MRDTYGIQQRVTYQYLLPDAHLSVLAAHLPPLRAQGTADVVRPGGRLANWVADRLRLPKAGMALPVTISVREVGGVLHWERTFGDSHLATTQTLEAGLMHETLGAHRITFRVTTSDGSAVYESVGSRWRGIRIPALLCPKAKGVVSPNLEGWKVAIEVRAPFLGLICAYTATLALE
jgi:hypothetical protein